jgi:hypothetical protein
VSFPENAGADLEARTTAGKIRVDHQDVVSRERSRRKLVARVNGGGPLLELRTSGGGIRVHASELRDRRRRDLRRAP